MVKITPRQISLERTIEFDLFNLKVSHLELSELRQNHTLNFFPFRQSGQKYFPFSFWIEFGHSVAIIAWTKAKVFLIETKFEMEGEVILRTFYSV